MDTLTALGKQDELNESASLCEQSASGALNDLATPEILDTILFDLDGTLLPMAQDAFIEAYFRELSAKFAALGLEPERSIQAVWAGTKAMLKNDGSVSNSRRFWTDFCAYYRGLETRLKYIEAETDKFYENEFNRVQAIIPRTELPSKIISIIKSKGYTPVLATNPLFPPQALASRLSWIGLTLGDFSLHTDYHNARFCKPNSGYYMDIFSALNIKPGQCLMVGNSVAEDMCASTLGCAAYLVVDYLENPDGADYSQYPQGTFDDFFNWAAQLPQL